MRSVAEPALVLALATAAASLLSWGDGRQDAATGAAAAAVRGLAVTYQSLTEPGTVQVQRARLLALHVERGEAPTPFLPPGMFRATFQGRVVLPVRDRYRFRVSGKGTVDLRANGEPALQGVLRPGQAIESQPIRLAKGDNEIVLVLESTALGEATLRLEWSCLDFGWEPIQPEAWRMADAPDLQQGERRRAGLQLFQERRCAACHRADPASAVVPTLHPGPDLRDAGARLHPQWIATWLQDPTALRVDARMPRLHGLDARQAADIAAYLAGLGTPAPRPEWTAAQAEAGGRRFAELGCVACHVAPGADPAPAPDRIALGDLAAKWHAAALVQFLLRPRASHPDPRMPDFGLSEADASALAAWLLSTAAPPAAAVAGDPGRGAELVATTGCARCHAVAVEDRSSFPPLDALDAGRGCLAAEPSGAPAHGLSEAQRAALVEFLPHARSAPTRKAPGDDALRGLASLRCTACHGLDGEPSTWAGVVHAGNGGEPPPPEEDPVAQGVPALTWVGDKLQPGWLQRFLGGTEASPRPWLVARMPSFHGDDLAVVRGLARTHGLGDRDDPGPQLDTLLAAQGARLIAMGEGFGCVQCHAVAGRPPVQVFERQGIDLRVAAGRLRHAFYTRWLADPTRIDADSRMPRYADGKGRTAFTDVLGGDAARQFEAIWHHLQSLR